MTYNKPTHLSGALAEMWDELRALAGDNPEAAVKVTDSSKFAAIDALSAVGGCNVTKVAEGVEVTLLFAPEAQAEMPVVGEVAVAKQHKFA